MRNYWQLQAPDGGALHQCHSKAAVLCNRPHGWKGVAPRCRRSPRSELELFYAQNELKVLACRLAENKCLHCWHLAGAAATIAARHATAQFSYVEPVAPALLRATSCNKSKLKAATKSSRAALVKRRRRRKDVAPRRKIAGVPRRGRATGAAAVHGMEPQYDSKRCQKNGVARRARDAAAHRCW